MDPLVYVHPRVNVLAISPLLQTRTQLRNVFQHTSWKLLEAQTCQDGVTMIEASRSPVVVCESVLPDGSWKRLLEQTELLPQRPVVLVTSAQADEALWTEVLSRGGFDLLVRPFQLQEVVRIVSLAYLQATARHSSREHARARYSAAGAAYSTR